MKKGTRLVSEVDALTETLAIRLTKSDYERLVDLARANQELHFVKIGAVGREALLMGIEQMERMIRNR